MHCAATHVEAGRAHPRIEISLVAHVVAVFPALLAGARRLLCNRLAGELT